MNRQLRTQPGLIDLQVNGYAGHDVNADDVDVETLADLTHALWAQGVTTYLPTVITASEEKITHVLAVIAAARRSDPLLAHSIRSEEHTSELQSRGHLVCRLLLEKKKE